MRKSGLTMRRAIPKLLLSCVCLSLGGCELSTDERMQVAGIVRIDGQPLKSGTVRFVPEIGRPASSAIMTDGSFELASESIDKLSQAGVPAGNYRVQVSASKIVDDKTIRWHVPQRYADFRTSGLDVTIDKSTNDLVIDLTWADEKPEGSTATEGAVEAEHRKGPSDELPESKSKGAS
jgi:hypothetical protein